MSFQTEVPEKSVGAEVQKIVDYGERTELILSDLDNGNWRITADSRQFWTHAATPGEAQAMREEIQRLREALNWYADEANHWRSHSDDMCMSDVDNDGGYRAREALKEGRE